MQLAIDPLVLFVALLSQSRIYLVYFQDEWGGEVIVVQVKDWKGFLAGYVRRVLVAEGRKINLNWRCGGGAWFFEQEETFE